MVCELLKLYNEEDIKLRSYRKRACYFGYQFCLVLRDEDGMNWWLRHAYRHSLMSHGPEHPDTVKLRAYVKDPYSHPAAQRRHPIFGLLMPVLCLLLAYFAMRWFLNLYRGLRN